MIAEQLGAQGIARRILQFHVERSANPQTAGIDAVTAVLGSLAEFLDQLAANFFEKVARIGRTFLPLPDQTQPLAPRAGTFLGGNEIIGDHLVNDEIAATERQLLMLRPAVAFRRLGQDREEGHFVQLEIGNVLVEIGPARRLDPEAAPTERDFIEIELENLALAQHTLDPPCQDHLLELAGNRIFVAKQHVLGDLLGDRGTAHRALARAHLAGVIEHRVGGTGEIDAAMAEEGPVLGCEIRFDQRGGKIDILQLDTAFARVGMDDLAIDAAHHGRQRGFVIEQALGIGKPARKKRPSECQHDQAQRQQTDAPAKPAIPAPVAQEPVARSAEIVTHAVTDCLKSGLLGHRGPKICRRALSTLELTRAITNRRAVNRAGSARIGGRCAGRSDRCRRLFQQVFALADEIDADRARHHLGKAGAAFGRGQALCLVAVGDEAALVEHRGYVGRPQHFQRRGTARLGVEGDRPLAFALDQRGEFGGFALGTALRQFDEDGVHRIALPGDVLPVDPVRAVLALGKARRRLARCTIRKRVDASPCHLGRLPGGIGVDGKKQVGAQPPRDFVALGVQQVAVLVAGQRNADLALLDQPVAQSTGEMQHQILFLQPLARGARIMTAVARVDHHQRQIAILGRALPGNLWQRDTVACRRQFDPQNIAAPELRQGERAARRRCPYHTRKKDNGDQGEQDKGQKPGHGAPALGLRRPLAQYGCREIPTVLALWPC